MPLPVQDVGEILARLDRSAPVAGDLIALDADGTLWSGDVGNDLLNAAIEGRRLRPEALEALRVEAERAGLSADGDANACARTLFEAYLAGRYDEERTFVMTAWAFAGFDEASLAAFCDAVVEEVHLAARRRPWAERVLSWARGRGAKVVVVSAAPEAMIHAAVRPLGIPPDDVVAMAPAYERGIMLPSLRRPPVYGPGKLRALRETWPDARVLAAFGDSGFDVPMLKAAAIPVAVAPSAALIEAAAEIPDLVEVC